MKGLFLKDWYIIKQNQKLYGVLLGVYALWSILAKENIGMMGAMILLSPILLMALFAYDEQAEWESYGLTLPVTRKQMVTARYAFAFTIVVSIVCFTMLVMLVNQMIWHTQYDVGMLFMTTTLALLLLSILLPIVYWLGTQKARIVLMIMVMCPTLVVLLLQKDDVPVPSMNELPILPSILAFIAVLVLLAGSMLLSVKIFSRKEI